MNEDSALILPETEAGGLDYRSEGILLPPVIPNMLDWPITRLLRDPRGFTAAVEAETLQQLQAHALRRNRSLHDLVEETMYNERIRMYEDPWKIDPRDEPRFWRSIKRGLVEAGQLRNAPDAYEAQVQALMASIVARYADEITSKFRPSTYHFAKRVLPFVFSSLLNASVYRTIRSVIKHRIGLQDRVHLRGEIDTLRSLARRGTILLTPTHISNLDSVLVGWGLHALGLPAFTYGAGLNLFNYRLIAYFMSRIGAYKVDRRKRNPIYRATLDAYSTLAIERGCHSIFFPGGTRARDGMIEKNLKLGLLGTAIEAQRRLFLPGGNGKKVFIVPMVMSYHFVLEAASLIKQHLTRTGKEQYYVLDAESDSYLRILSFVWKTFSATSDITLNFGRPMDVMGNFVDANGDSFDPQGRKIDIRGYFSSHGELREDPQRDDEYTRQLGERLVERYHAEHTVFSSHLVAFVAFEWLKRQFPRLDIYELLRIQEDERHIPLDTFLEATGRVLARIRVLRATGKIQMAEHLHDSDLLGIVKHGVKNLGVYHEKRPLTFHDEKTLDVEDMSLLLYYHNRLEGYEFGNYI